jgi:large subunit ribosomal protein L35
MLRIGSENFVLALSPGAKAFVTRGNCAYLPRLMPKAIARSKTRKAVSKRFKITGTGKVMRQHASRRHLLSSKSAKRKRHMAKSAEVDKTDTARIKSNMPFG